MLSLKEFKAKYNLTEDILSNQKMKIGGACTESYYWTTGEGFDSKVEADAGPCESAPYN